MGDVVVKVLVVVGTRPEAIKLAPVIAQLRQTPWCDPVTAVTGQHREIVDEVFELWGIRPDRQLDVLRPGQGLAALTTRCLAGVDTVLADTAPDMVVVQGDTTSTFAGALAAFYRSIPVAHVEAGLRTGDPAMPFPEEMNRRMATRLASLHLAPTARAASALRGEGVPDTQVLVTGNTVIDALRWVVANRPAAGQGLPGPDEGSMVLVTAHRRESWGAPMRRIGAALRTIAEEEPSVAVVFPMHPNPVVRKAIQAETAGLSNVVLTEPLRYERFCALLARATVVLTDSGGIQEEAPGLGKPVLVMRETTERPEAVEAGVARLVGTDRERIVAEVLRLLRDPEAYRAMSAPVSPFGDGRAAERTVAAIGHYFGIGERLPAFDASD